MFILCFMEITCGSMGCVGITPRKMKNRIRRGAREEEGFLLSAGGRQVQQMAGWGGVKMKHKKAAASNSVQGDARFGGGGGQGWGLAAWFGYVVWSFVENKLKLHYR